MDKNYSISPEKSTVLNKKSLLWVGNISNALCLIFSFHHNTWNYGNKWDLSPFNSFWEFFTIWWCVWSSMILFVYNFREITEINSNDKLKTDKVKNGRLGLIMASASLTSIIGFTLMIIGKVLSARGRESLFSSPLSWWIYSFTWHYLVFPLSLIYFFKYSQEESFSKKNLLYLAIPLPMLYFSANLARSFFAGKKYFDNKPFLGNGIWWFSYLEKGNYVSLLVWIMVSIFYFWVISYLLLKFKKWLRLPRKFPLVQKLKHKNLQKKSVLTGN